MDYIYSNSSMGMNKNLFWYLIIQNCSYDISHLTGFLGEITPSFFKQYLFQTFHILVTKIHDKVDRNHRILPETFR